MATTATGFHDIPHTRQLIHPGWRVTLAGTAVNLALGILYSWSIIAGFLKQQGWTAMQTQIPYMVACGVFALLMVPGGRMQDKVGPRVLVTVAGVLAGVGMMAASWMMTVLGLSICFGVLFGAAMGLGYSSTTPPAMKWFAPGKRGLITGIVVAGFGLASVYAAPLTNHLVKTHGIESTFLFLGAGFLIAIVVLAQFIANPPAGYVPEESGKGVAKKRRTEGDMEWKQMMRDGRFYALWGMFCVGSLSGLMVIGQLKTIAAEQSGIKLGFILVAVLAVFNAGGRITGGMLFDRLGQQKTLLLIFGLQTLNFLFFRAYVSPVTILLGTVLAGSCYGACLSVFPATTATLFGVKNLGVNYGLVFTAWGAGGVFGGLIGGMVRDMTGSFSMAYVAAAALSLVAVGLTFVLRPRAEELAAEAA
ncbi:MAG: transporter, family, oxalate/formate antiporter [Candidatus Sumerlaeota bacterium]|nr:transporter, family, oxalate/formate antiporter [Candidatus Sumerlaeota bacterium]